MGLRELLLGRDDRRGGLVVALAGVALLLLGLLELLARLVEAAGRLGGALLGLARRARSRAPPPSPPCRARVPPCAPRDARPGAPRAPSPPRPASRLRFAASCLSAFAGFARLGAGLRRRRRHLEAPPKPATAWRSRRTRPAASSAAVSSSSAAACRVVASFSSSPCELPPPASAASAAASRASCATSSRSLAAARWKPERSPPETSLLLRLAQLLARREQLVDVLLAVADELVQRPGGERRLAQRLDLVGELALLVGPQALDERVARLREVRGREAIELVRDLLE